MKLTIVYTSDVHGQLTSCHYPTNERQNKGLVRLKSALETLEGPTLLLDNGDILQGSVLLDYQRQHAKVYDHPVVTAMTHLPYAAMTLGNHDFNYGQAYLYDVLNQLNIPVVCANLKTDKGERVFEPYIIKDINGLNVAIIGAITHYVPVWEKPEHIEGLVFEDALSAVKETVLDVKDNVDLVIVLYHGGFERDLTTGEPIGRATSENQGYQMAQLEGVDLLLCGHQHLPTVKEIPQGPLVLQPPANATHVGVATFEKQADCWLKTGQLLPLNTPIDPRLNDALGPLEEATQAWLDTPVATSPINCEIKDPFLARKDNHPLFQWIHSLQLEKTGADLSIASLPNDAPGFKETIHLRDVAANFVYPNTLIVLKMTGEALLAAIHQSVNYVKRDQHTFVINEAFIYPKVEHYNYDSYYPLDLDVLYNKDGTFTLKTALHGKPIDPQKHYTVVLNNYRAAGGGDYTMFKDATLLKEYDASMFDLAVARLKKDGALMLPKANRLNFILN